VPFFLISYAEQVRGGGQGGASLAVPWTVAQVIGQRVAALPGPAKELLSVAAVAGQVVPYTLLAQVTSSDDEQVLEAVERRWRPGCWPRTGRTGTGSPTT
jgi:predicted ATPase